MLSETAGRDLEGALAALSRVASVINSNRPLDEMLERVTAVAAELIGAHQGVTSLTVGDDWSQAINTVHLSDKYAEWRDYDEQPTGAGIYSEVCARNEPMRLRQAELEAHPAWRAFGTAADRHPPMRGWLAAPLVGRDGRNLGLIQLSDRFEGEFDTIDEALLLQIANMAAIAIEQARLGEALAEQQAARFRDELISGISHDMQTPMGTILGLTGLLLDENHTPPAEQREMLEIVHRQTRSLRGLVQQFLDFSRLQSGRELQLRREPVDIGAAIDRIVELFAHKREMIVGVAAGLPQVTGDRDRIDQMLANLVGNATKYSDDAVRVTARHENGEVVISVVDQGRGIDEDELPRLFEKFQRGDTAAGVEGTGLGLYITSAVAEAHGGQLRVHSTPGVGSRFQLRLPARTGS